MENQSQQMPQPPQMPPYPPYYMQKKKSRWWIPVVIIVGVLIVFIGIIMAFFSALTSPFEKKDVVVKSNSVLYLNFGNVLDEYPVSSPFGFLGASGKSSFFDIVSAIKIAKNDDKIKGIYYRATIAQMGFAMASELQNALDDFKKSGKFIYAFIEVGQEREYFNALPADSIFMPTEGLCEMNGFGISALFLKGFFDKIGIDFYVQQFEDFKSAAETYSRKKFSDSAKLEYQIILNQRYKLFTESVVKHRKMEPDFLNSALARGIYTADSLQKLGFVDAFATESEVKEFLAKRAFGNEYKDDSKHKLRLVSPSDYLAGDPPIKGKVFDKKKQIAIIFAVGVVQDDAQNSPFSNEHSISTKEFVKNLKKARDDENIKAIIIRIDSPGGSVITSDAIWEEIMKTKKVKPIYASMSDVAGSGGYYIPMACDTIICHPATITGSIGVISAIPNASGLCDKLGITTDTLSTSPNANFLNFTMPFPEKNKEKFYDLSKGIYYRFIQRVADSRKMTFDQVHAIAKGRVWTGEDAMKIGLVDVLGGLDDAIKIAKRRVGCPDSMKVYVQTFPKPVEDIESLLKMFGLGGGDDDEEISLNSRFSNILNIKPDMVSETIKSFPVEIQSSIKYMSQLLGISKKENTMVAMPYYIDIK